MVENETVASLLSMRKHFIATTRQIKNYTRDA